MSAKVFRKMIESDLLGSPRKEKAKIKTLGITFDELKKKLYVSDLVKFRITKTQYPSYSNFNNLISMVSVWKYKSEKRAISHVFHEIGHWTGSSENLRRPGCMDVEDEKSKKYAIEETIAEIVSMMLCYKYGMKFVTPSAIKYINKYLDPWYSDPEKKRKILKTCITKAEAGFEVVERKMGL